MNARKERTMQATIPLTYRPVPAMVRRRPSRAVYRRRRIAVLLCAATVFALGWMGLHRHGADGTGAFGGGPLTAAGPSVRIDATLASHTHVIVQPGDTLWTIARRVQPTGDIRPLVSSIDAQRHGRPLQVGETIHI
jgi:nucleoid-associated protein YgaU